MKTFSQKPQNTTTGVSPDYWLLLPKERTIVPSTLVFSVPVFSDFLAPTEKCQVIKKTVSLHVCGSPKLLWLLIVLLQKTPLFPRIQKLFSETTELNPAKVHEVLV